MMDRYTVRDKNRLRGRSTRAIGAFVRGKESWKDKGGDVARKSRKWVERFSSSVASLLAIVVARCAVVAYSCGNNRCLSLIRGYYSSNDLTILLESIDSMETKFSLNQ